MSKKIIFVIITIIILICCMQSCSKENMPITTKKTEQTDTNVKDTSSIPPKDIGCGTSLPYMPGDIGCSTPEPYTLEEFYAEKQKNNLGVFIKISDIFPQIPEINKYVTMVKYIDGFNKTYGYNYYLEFDSQSLIVNVEYCEKVKDNKISSYLTETRRKWVDDFSKIKDEEKNVSVAVVQSFGGNEIAYTVISGKIVDIGMAVDNAIITFLFPSYYLYPDKIDNLDELKAKDPCYDLITALLSNGSECEQVYNAIKQSIKANVEYGNPTIKPER